MHRKKFEVLYRKIGFKNWKVIVPRIVTNNKIKAKKIAKNYIQNNMLSYAEIETKVIPISDRVYYNVLGDYQGAKQYWIDQNNLSNKEFIKRWG